MRLPPSISRQEREIACFNGKFRLFPFFVVFFVSFCSLLFCSSFFLSPKYLFFRFIQTNKGDDKKKWVCVGGSSQKLSKETVFFLCKKQNHIILSVSLLVFPLSFSSRDFLSFSFFFRIPHLSGISRKSALPYDMFCFDMLFQIVMHHSLIMVSTFS